MPPIIHHNSRQECIKDHGIHAKALLEANEERIHALNYTLKMLEKERYELCSRLQDTVKLSVNEINWLFRPASPLQCN